MNDEEWVSSVGIDEATWLTGMQQRGLEVNGHYERYKAAAQVAAGEK